MTRFEVCAVFLLNTSTMTTASESNRYTIRQVEFSSTILNS